ncbi:MAG: imidazole glycerol phosphate synthase subunit HisH [Clostridiales bacterium]|nr:imidazole glycerol phosphate synthase subunit HisH [Clostridiales bacterium]
MGYIAVVDYDVGNLMSVNNGMKYLGFSTRVTADPKELELADAIILPGVGAFPDAAAKLEQRGMMAEIRRQSAKKPVLGICLGMQLLFETGYEIREAQGLGLIPGTVEYIQTQYKLPHIGWNSLTFHTPSPLFDGVEEGSYVYFVHSFRGMPTQAEDVIAATDYGTEITAAVQRGNVFGTQFHPEKSGDIGLQMLRNFGGLNR